ncbi:golgin subfamily A member 6-like protein 22 [Carex littledalei]|uniref:Golgin subfamily A member 6-like protein 22 n=1 Tax=Carex littledalei TaxID=544730 RepID=A0A833RA46_9POAL|nr:golgin subfamily A member 6-like protein 22 [Carex littledalei]
MGLGLSKCYTKRHENVRQLRAKIQILEEEIKEMRRAREKESQAYEQHVTAFAFKEEDSRQEKKKQKEENAKLRLKLKEEEERVKRLEKAAEAVQGVKDWQEFGTSYIVEQMKQEQARREEAVEKWKQLYLAIKTELDDLIQRTHQTNGERYCWRAEQGIVEELQRELKSKEEEIASLKEKIQTVEKEGMRREREIDILRQSLRILSSSKRSRSRKSINPRGLRT